MIRGIASNVDDGAIDGDLGRLAAALGRRAAAGFDGAELNVCGLNVVRAGTVVPEEIRRVREVLRRHPLRYMVHAPNSLNLTRLPERAERVMAACLRAAADLGAEVLVYHSGQIALHDPARGLAPLPDERELARLWERETVALRPFVRQAGELGLTLVVENRDPHLWELAALARHGRGAEDLLLYHQGMRLDLLAGQVAALEAHHVGICLDVGHAFLAAPYWAADDYISGVRKAAPWVRHIHLHDNYGLLDDVADGLAERLVFGEADCHLPPGWGRIPLAETLAALDAAGYEGWIVAEIRPRYEAHLTETHLTTRSLLPGA